MDNEWEYTVPCDYMVVLDSPSADSKLLNFDMNTEVLDVCESNQQLRDQMEDHCEKEVVLDSDDEEGNQNEAVNLVDGYSPVIGRLSCSDATGFLRRRQVPAGCFRKQDNKFSEHECLHSARRERTDGESTAGKTGLYNDNRFQEHCVVVDNVVSISSDQKPIPSAEGSIDGRKFSSHECKTMDMGKDTQNNSKLAGFNCVESPESAESQYKALRFVDRFLSVSDLCSGKDIETRKTNMRKPASSFRSTGSHSLARRINIQSSANKLKTFNWIEKPIQKDQCTSIRMNKDWIFEFEDDKSGCLSVNQDPENVNLHDKASNLQSKEKMPVNMLRGTEILSSKDSKNTGSNSGIHIAYDSMELDTQLDAGLSRQNVEKVETFSPVLDPLDIGLDTQVAAEAMEELINAPPRIDDCFTHQCSDNGVLGYKWKSNHVAKHEESFGGWRSKGKRSKRMKVPTVQDKSILFRRISKESTDSNKSNSSFKRRKMISFHGDINNFLKFNFSSSSKVKTDTAKTEENSHLDVADRTCSKLSLWVHPKGKRAQRTPRLSISSSNECSPCVGIKNNMEKYATTNEEAHNEVAKLLVYKRRNKFPLERDQIRNSLKLAVDLCSTVKDNAVCDKEVPIPIVSDTGKPLGQCGILDEREPSSVGASSNLKSGFLSNKHYMTLQALEVGDKRKQTLNPLLSSPLMKELTRLGHTGLLPDFFPKDSRKQRAKKKICILFSQNLESSTLKQQKKIVARLGLSIATCFSNATHFVADRFARTRNMLQSIALGMPVVTHLWLESCEQAGCVIDEKNFILRDEKKEKEIGFNMLDSLICARKLPLLKGRRVLITPNVKPGIEVINDLVKAVQGQAIENLWAKKMKDKLIHDAVLIISCEEDYTICLQFLDKGASIYDSELLLNGIVTQKLEFERHRLFKDFKKNGHSCLT